MEEKTPLRKIRDLINKEKLYVFLLTFAIFTNIIFSLLNNFIKDSGLSPVLKKELRLEESTMFDQKITQALETNDTLYRIFITIVIFFTLLFILGVAIDAVFLSKKSKHIEIIKNVGDREIPAWNVLDVFKAIIIFLTAEAIIYVLNIYFLIMGIAKPDDNMHLLIGATLLDLIAVLAVFYFVLGKGQNTLSSLGLRTKNIFLNIKYGILAYIGLIPVFVMITIATSVIFSALNIPVEPQEVVKLLKIEKSLPSLIYMCFFTSLLGPFMEEIFFRGFLYGAIRKIAGVSGGIVISSLFFAYVHSNLASFAPILSLGILLAYIYEKTGSLISAITAHIIHNSVMLAFLLFLRSIIN